MKNDDIYCRRTWLNPINSISTGSVVTFHGLYKYPDESIETKHMFIEIGSCHSKVRLHANSNDTPADFINKLILLRNEIDLFIDHLKSEY